MPKRTSQHGEDLFIRGEARKWLGLEEMTAVQLKGDHVMKLKDEVLIDIPISELVGKTLVVTLIANPPIVKTKKVRGKKSQLRSPTPDRKETQFFDGYD